MYFKGTILTLLGPWKDWPEALPYIVLTQRQWNSKSRTSHFKDCELIKFCATETVLWTQTTLATAEFQDLKQKLVISFGCVTWKEQGLECNVASILNRNIDWLLTTLILQMCWHYQRSQLLTSCEAMWMCWFLLSHLFIFYFVKYSVRI